MRENGGRNMMEGPSKGGMLEGRDVGREGRWKGGVSYKECTIP